MREKYKSQLEKHGEGDAHMKARDRLVNILMDAGWEVFPDSGLWINWKHTSKHGSNLRQADPFGGNDYGYYHEFDVYARKEHSNRLRSEIVMEIDGTDKDGRHTDEVEKAMDLPNRKKKKQENRDRTAEEYAAFFLPDATFYRVPIDILIGRRMLDDASFKEQYGLK